MTSAEIRAAFLDFFDKKGHKIVPSAPIVNKDDPTLMFINAGMNPFKDYFLGNETPDNPRIADTQKCLRVSGKHNDLEEVGRDSYHQTFFEMLGNWSIGDYFKEEAINWAWELLTDILGLDKERLYATVFEGDKEDMLDADLEAFNLWKTYLPESRILMAGKKDNFWEMGETGPCGPCSEIHIDLRSSEDRKKLDGAALVNQDHPQVIEIWNLVFIQFNRMADNSLQPLPDKHIDTGMGFERLCMAMQGKISNYDTDLFTPLIAEIEKLSGKKYTSRYEETAKTDIAMRVVADHVRAVSVAIADGQLPSNTGAGYVIRRILRRAVRYYYSFLDVKEPMLHRLVPVMIRIFEGAFPELDAQQSQIAKVIQGEEKAFLNTLETGLKRFAALNAKDGKLPGSEVFELYDTYGFPIDLTRLLAVEKGWIVDEDGFLAELNQQKERARAATKQDVSDWHTVGNSNDEVEFMGYDHLKVENTSVIKYRSVKTDKKTVHHIVLSKTPFYAESGGQAGDTGTLTLGNEKVKVVDTKKENNLIIHITDKLPKEIDRSVTAEVDMKKREATSANHSATHLMHAALHQVVGSHALQKGQDVNNKRLRFDFAHFEKMSAEQLQEIEDIVNGKVRKNIQLDEQRDLPIAEAEAAGAMMLFGEKYGELVRVITFEPGFSSELCGGTHVPSTGHIGSFKIVSESAVAAGIRRIEAVTGVEAQNYFKNQLSELNEVRSLFKNSQNLTKQLQALIDENKELKRNLSQMQAEQAAGLKDKLKSEVIQLDNGIQLLVSKLPIQDSNTLKTLAHQLESELGKAVLILAAEINDKPQLMVLISKSLTQEFDLHAGNIIRNAAKHIQGGGGGQPFFATAGGKNAQGIKQALEEAKNAVLGVVG